MRHAGRSLCGGWSGWGLALVAAPVLGVGLAGLADPIDTTVTILEVIPEPSLIGQAYNVEFQVVPNSSTGGASINGTITVSDGVNTCNKTVDSDTPDWPYSTGCRWDSNSTSTSVGDKTITATFEAELAFNDSSDTISQTVFDKINTTLIIDGSNAVSSVIGQSYTVTGIVHESGSGDPTGSVDVDEGEARFLIQAGTDTAFQGRTSIGCYRLPLLRYAPGSQGGSG